MLITCPNCNAKVDVYTLLSGCPSCKPGDRTNFGTIIENISPYALTNAGICDICSRSKMLCTRTFSEKCSCATKIRNKDQFHLLCMSGEQSRPCSNKHTIAYAFSMRIENKVRSLINVQLIAEAFHYSVIYGAFVYLFCGPNCLYYKECGDNRKEIRNCLSSLKIDPEEIYKKMYIESLIDGSDTTNVLDMLWDDTLCKDMAYEYNQPKNRTVHINN